MRPLFKAITFILLFFVNSGISQNRLSPLNPGCYESLNGFLKGEAECSYPIFQFESLFIDLNRFQLIDAKEEQKHLFGIADRKNFYLNANVYSQNHYFVKSLLIGRYIYFEDIIYDISKPAELLTLSQPPIYEKKMGIVIDVKKGKVRLLDEEQFFEIIKPYPEFLKMYEDSNKSINAKRTLIRKINEI